MRFRITSASGAVYLRGDMTQDENYDVFADFDTLEEMVAYADTIGHPVIVRKKEPTDTRVRELTVYDDYLD